MCAVYLCDFSAAVTVKVLPSVCVRVSMNIVKWSSQGMLRLTQEAMNELFQPTINNIVRHIGEKNNNAQAHETDEHSQRSQSASDSVSLSLAPYFPQTDKPSPIFSHQPPTFPVISVLGRFVQLSAGLMKAAGVKENRKIEGCETKNK